MSHSYVIYDYVFGVKSISFTLNFSCFSHHISFIVVGMNIALLPYARNILHHAKMKKKESTIDKLFGYKISFTLCILCVCLTKN